MAGKTRSSSTAEEFTKHLDNYIKNSEAFKNTIISAVQAAVFPLQEEITNLKDQLAKLKSELNEVKVKANSNEQYILDVTLFASLGLMRKRGRIAMIKSLTFARTSWKFRYVGKS